MMRDGWVRTAARLVPATLIALLVCALPAQAAPDCRGRLEFDQVYECEFRSDLASGVGDGTLLFEEFDGNAFQATLDILGEVTVAHCTCKTGQPDRFDRAKAFECVSGFAASIAETFEGVVTGNGGKIHKGQIWSSDPLGQGFARFVFNCALSDQADSEVDSDGDSEDDSDGDSEDDSDGDSEDDSDGDSEADSDDDGDSGGEKVLICHKGKKTMEVPASAVQKHLNHGDSLGPCE